MNEENEISPSNAPSPSGLSTKGRLGFLFRDSALYGGAAAVSRLATLITFPLLARHLSTSDYGIFDTLQVLGAFLTILFIFGQDSAVSRFFYEYETTEARKQVIAQSLAFRGVLIVIFVPLLWTVGPAAIRHFGYDGETVFAFRILVLQVPCMVIIELAVTLLRLTFRRWHFVTFSLAFSFVQAAFVVCAILVFNAGIGQLMIANFAAALIFALIALLLTRDWLTRPSDAHYLREMLPYAAPYGLISASRAVGPLAERALVAALIGTEALGLYAAGAKIAMLFSLFAFAFQTAWNPFALAVFKKSDAAETYNAVLKSFTLAVCLASFTLLILAEPLLVLLASEAYRSGVVVIFPLVLALAIEAVGWVTEIGVVLAKRSGLKLVAYILAFCVTILAILILAPTFGISGCAWAVVLGSVTKTAFVTLFAQRAYPLPWVWSPIYVLLPSTMVLGVLALALDAVWPVMLGFAILPVLSYLFVFDHGDRVLLAGLVRRL
ncbi:lipopolysaccharide biosynthesis protein [Ruegeria arenilitoris]|uniref:lipopolysaccharide biosynthesis protein n=1 Tax=Ruegeria arenilitoris TaxID=1173585 RepID=UPI001480361E|nr:oligosaccharide flippase family protein [Ruegeria arenilitoris]